MSDTLKQIADNLGVGSYPPLNQSYLYAIANYYGVNTTTSKNLMADILTAVGGNPATSSDHLKDIVLALGGTVTVNGNWMEAWEAISAVPASPPVNSVLPVISGTAVVGSVLTTTDGTWTNSPTSFAYQWKRGVTNIGTNSQNYTLVQADAGENITCVVTATNGAGSTPATSNSLLIFDFDANAFFDRVTAASGTLTLTEQTATNTLVIQMKTGGIFTLMKAIYPMVGASSQACAQNLKDNTFTGSFSNGWTFASTGATPNGTSAFMNTSFNALTNFNANSHSFGIYSRINSTATARGYGVSDGTNFTVHNLQGFIVSGSATNNVISYIGNPSTSLIMATRQNINLVKGFRANVSLGTNTSARLGTMPNFDFYFGARNASGTANLFSLHELAFAYLSDGLSDAQAITLYNSVQAFQTTLSRQL